MEIDYTEYVIEDYKDINVLRQQYPEIKFTQVSNQIYIAQVPEWGKRQLDELIQDSQYVQYSHLYGLNADEALQASGISVFHNYTFGQLRGTGVLIGFVDTGIDYTNDNFRFEDGSSRIRFIWDQTIDGSPPKEYDFGTEYTKAMLDEALRADNPLEIVPTTDDIGHGTYIAGVAGGRDRLGSSGFTGGAPDSEFVVVKMAPAQQVQRDYYFVKEDVPAYSDGALITGLDYLIHKASELNKPMVICIAVGSNAGAHNGTNMIERYIRGLTLYPGIIVVTAAGNEANAAHHYKGEVSQNEVKSVELNVADTENGFFLHIWSHEVDKLAIGVRTPIGQIIDKVPLSLYKTETFKFTLQKTEIVVDYVYPESNTGGQLILLRFVAPIPGIWRIDIYGDYIINGQFNMWLPRVGFIETTTRFSEPNISTTVCVPASDQFNFVVGGYDVIDGSLYAASGRGPTVYDANKPDIIAPCINVTGPWLNNTFINYTGTSVAAAITAGGCALLLEWGVVNENLRTINTRIARNILCRGADRKVGVVYPDDVEGYGRLNLQDSFLEL
ncbi:MAG: hypothetical protein ATN35_10740 [Epulopiscium sp. Nele67-Bin004]|nr:MAG: hypothetical protein ATN35_10740 [Epulopiscium sp. Nele67-Bin004]